MNALEKAWYRGKRWILLLAPLALMFRLITLIRRFVLQTRYQGQTFTAPVVVVGNIVLGGAGKTPLIIALTRQLQAAGFRPGIVSRGYGGAEAPEPVELDRSHTPDQVGDEPRLIADMTACPVVVCPDRSQAVKHLLNHNDCNVVLSDDGLQHYRLHRDIEIAVVDGERGLGNGWCLPVGPLREPPARLHEVDMVVVNGEGYQPGRDFFTMTLAATGFQNLVSGQIVLPEDWTYTRQVHAVAGIANPQRFQRTLEGLGFSVVLKSFPDHHRFSPQDLVFTDDAPVVITAKDAVKCQGFDNNNVWVLDVEAQLPERAWQYVIQKLT